VPESLRERILAAVREGEDGRRGAAGAEVGPPVSRRSLPDALREAGDRLLAVARAGPASRDTALTLLAADALMTFACEAMAEQQPGALGTLR
jgi:uncharacterized membrane protein